MNRGIAIYQGKIIAPVIDGRLEALDAETGKPLWEARVAYPDDLSLRGYTEIVRNNIVRDLLANPKGMSAVPRLSAEFLTNFDRFNLTA